MIVDDLISVRFLSKPYNGIENLRIGSNLISPWLESNNIQFVACRQKSLIFTLPDKYRVLERINFQVIDALRPVERHAIDAILRLELYFASEVAKYAVPLTSDEILQVFSLTKQSFSFSKISRR